MYHCRGQRSCIGLSQVCDGVKQCKLGDDEYACDIHCPEGCMCSGLSFNCSYGGHSSMPSPLPDKLRYLNLNKNSLLSFKFTDGVLYYLSVLSLSGNFIRNLELDTFQYFPNLLSLDLLRNPIRVYQKGIFKGLSNCRKLKINENLSNARNTTQVEVGAFLGLSKVTVLDLSELVIFTIKANHFEGLVQVKSLILRLCNIYNIESGAFSGLYKVSHLDISDNPLVSFPIKMFDILEGSLQMLYSPHHKFCCMASWLKEDSCLPGSNVFSSCEYLMKYSVLRVFLWVVGLSSACGNVFVLVWRLTSRDRGKHHSILVSWLSLSDLFMGIYILILAAMDMEFHGSYIMHDETWRGSGLCQFAGIIATTSSQMSVFAMLFLTLDRFKHVVFPFHVKELRKTYLIILLVGTLVVAVVVSIIPTMPIAYFRGQFYARSPVCLGLHITSGDYPGWEYSFVLHSVINLVIFLVILFCYAWMYWVIRQSRKRFSGNFKSREVQIARKMAVVIMTDMVCLIPISLLGKRWSMKRYIRTEDATSQTT